jgi:UrcA family protein
VITSHLCREGIQIRSKRLEEIAMDTVRRIAVSLQSRTTTLAFVLLTLGNFVPTESFADPGSGTHKVTERGSVSLAGLDVLTPDGVRLANWRIQQMAQRLCLQIANMDERDAATCVSRAVADAQQKLNAVIQARLAERDAHAVASAPKH